MPRSVSVTEIHRNFADYINRVVYRGERFVLVRGGRAVAELSPVPIGASLGDLPGLMASLPRLGSEEAAAFADDLERSRAEMSTTEPPGDPWAS